MKEYLLLFRGGDNPDMQNSPNAFQAHMARWMQWMSDMQKQGRLVGGQPLSQEGKQLSGTNKVISDGPFMEGKEFVGGYLLIKATGFDEAVLLSKNCPILEFENGNVEVREIQMLHM